MGQDDRNEGGPGECPGHDWTTSTMTLAADGAYLEQTCTRCDAVRLVTPGDLTGRTG